MFVACFFGACLDGKPVDIFLLGQFWHAWEITILWICSGVSVCGVRDVLLSLSVNKFEWYGQRAPRDLVCVRG